MGLEPALGYGSSRGGATRGGVIPPAGATGRSVDAGPGKSPDPKPGQAGVGRSRKRLEEAVDVVVVVVHLRGQAHLVAQAHRNVNAVLSAGGHRPLRVGGGEGENRALVPFRRDRFVPPARQLFLQGGRPFPASGCGCCRPRDGGSRYSPWRIRLAGGIADLVGAGARRRGAWSRWRNPGIATTAQGSVPVLLLGEHPVRSCEHMDLRAARTSG